MDETTYRDALLRKRDELLGGPAAKPLQLTMENNSGRQGDMADQATGTNEVHIQLKLKQTDAKILQAIEGALGRLPVYLGPAIVAKAGVLVVAVLGGVKHRLHGLAD